MGWMVDGPVKAVAGYDAFISYSHSGDDLVAARLQAGLQGFAKPWWKRRAVRVFRDESSLAANPHLWGSIAEALDSSSWLVVLLSRDAAGSEWVNREVEYWLAHRPVDRIIPVLTEGEFSWSDDGLVSDAAPPALRGAFVSEPRWVDLRFGRSDEQLDLKNPRFSAAVADVAAAVRGVAKDELESEEVRQHRRTVRTAWAAGVLIAVLGVAAVVFGFQADEQRRLAETNAELAATNAAEAQVQAEEAAAQRDIALQREAEAEAAAAEAQRNEAFALQKAAVAEAGRLLDLASSTEEPSLTVSLALYAVALAGDGVTEIEPQVVSLLQSALPNYRAVADLDLDGGGFGAISPDGTTLLWIRNGWELRAIEVGAGEVRWSRELPYNNLNPSGIFVNPDGGTVVVPQVARSGLRIFVANTTSGALVADFEIERCAETGVELGVDGFSPDGRFLTVSESGVCEEETESSLVRVYETATWNEVARIEAVEVSFSADSSLAVVVEAGGAAELLAFPERELLRRFEGGYVAGALAPDGQRLALAPSSGPALLMDADSGEMIHELAVDDEISSEFGRPISFSPDGSKVALMTTGPDMVFDVQTGEKIAEFHNPVTWLHSWTADGEHLFIDSNSYALWYVGDEVLAEPVPLEFDELVNFALAHLRRGFSLRHCRNFRIEHCPLPADELRRMVESSQAGISE